MPYGDQAIFLKAEVFHLLGGFPDLPMMEDFELVRRLRKLGKIAIAPRAVVTSDRRWRSLGILRTTLANQVMVAGYLLGVDPHRLARWYRNLGKPR
jgi:GT2 family glycosyltransferase